MQQQKLQLEYSTENSYQTTLAIRSLQKINTRYTTVNDFIYYCLESFYLYMKENKENVAPAYQFVAGLIYCLDKISNGENVISIKYADDFDIQTVLATNFDYFDAQFLYKELYQLARSYRAFTTPKPNVIPPGMSQKSDTLTSGSINSFFHTHCGLETITMVKLHQQNNIN